MFLLSLPMRGRGLKCCKQHIMASCHIVAPHAGAWIEISPNSFLLGKFQSLPMRGRGLKCINRVMLLGKVGVAPHAGAWIEILKIIRLFSVFSRRSPCGGVD